MIITIINCVGLISGNICVFQNHIIIRDKKINKNGTLSGLHLFTILLDNGNVCSLKIAQKLSCVLGLALI